MFTTIRPLRSTLPAVLLALSSLPILALSPARAQTIQAPTPIGLTHAMTSPYSFTGRLFDLGSISFGTGTLVRRHTIVTAAHVVYSPSGGFVTGMTFSRALYPDPGHRFSTSGTFLLSRNQASSVAALTGYQIAADAAGEGNETLESGARDLGYVLTDDPPVDDNWGTYLADPKALTDNSGRFVLGYPGVSFNGRTMTYVVPMTPFVEVGDVGSGDFENEEFTTEPGNSGGPVYSVQNDQQVIVGELTAGIDDSTGEFNATFIRAIDTEADLFLTSAEYTSGLIAKIKFKGSQTVNRGTTVTYKLLPQFATAAPNDGVKTTNRYKELALTSDNAGTPSQPLVTIKKLNNRKFRVTFDAKLRSGTTVTFTAGYAVPATPTKNTPPGASADNINQILGATYKVKIQ